jgi:hypothetical protein
VPLRSVQPFAGQGLEELRLFGEEKVAGPVEYGGARCRNGANGEPERSPERASASTIPTLEDPLTSKGGTSNALLRGSVRWHLW